MSRNVALSTGVDAGTVTPVGTPLVPPSPTSGAVAVGSVAGQVDGVERAGTGRRRHLRDDLVPVADVDVLFAGRPCTSACRWRRRGSPPRPGSRRPPAARTPPLHTGSRRVVGVEGPGEAAVAEPVVAVHRRAEVGVRGALVGRVGAELHALHEARDALAVGAPGRGRARSRRHRGPAGCRRRRGPCSRSAGSSARRR